MALGHNDVKDNLIVIMKYFWLLWRSVIWTAKNSVEILCVAKITYGR